MALIQRPILDQVPVYANAFIGSYELGFKFTPRIPMQCLGTHYYRYSQCTYNVSWTGLLYSVAGQVVLASKQFSGETASGWQYQAFDAPVTLQAGVEYMVGLYKPNSDNCGCSTAIANAVYDLFTFPVNPSATPTSCTNYSVACSGAPVYPKTTDTNTWYGIDAMVQYDEANLPKLVLPAGCPSYVRKHNNVCLDGSTYLQAGLRMDMTEGNPNPPCIALDLPGKYTFRWGLNAGAHTLTCSAKQVSNAPAGFRPAMLIKANPDVGLNIDIYAEAGPGAGWVDIGPVAFTAMSGGTLEVELWNNDTANFKSTAYFDHVVKS